MTKRVVKTALRVLGGILGALLLVVIGYVLYVVLSYYRVEDNLELAVEGNATAAVPLGESLSLMTYNVGFGAYSPEYSFFMDGGVHSRALSKTAVEDNTAGAVNVLKAENPSFVLLQEVDVDGTRSYHVNQTALFAEGLSAYDRVFAQNYDSPYFAYPFHETIGANRSGLMTFSQYAMETSVRRSLPIENSFYKYLDLDRAYTVTEIPTEDGRVLALYNVHLSAYTSDGTIADEQLRMLSADMKAQYDAGNYVIAAGDFNKDLLGDSGEYFTRPEGAYNWAQPLDTSLLPQGFTCYSGTNAPTCRNADSAYRGDGTDFVLSVDGVIVSDNVTVTACETVDIGFAYSDHNPVKLQFVLGEETAG